MNTWNSNPPKAVEKDSLAHNPWMRVVSRYLTWSIRAGAYAANFHFVTLIDDHVAAFIASPLLRNLVYLVYGVFLYEIAIRIVRARYRPAFICSSEVEQIHSVKPVLNEADYLYRVAAEKLIYVSAIYYGFNLFVAVTCFILLPVGGDWLPIGLGLLGGFLSVMNFFGVVVMASSGTAFSLKSMPMYLMAVGFVIPLLGYLVYTFRWVVTG